MPLNHISPGGRWTGPAPVPADLAKKIRQLVEVEKLQQWKVAEALGLTKKQLWRCMSKMELKRQRTGPRSGAGHPEWKGGRKKDDDGYVLLYMPDHPNARGKYILEHRLVMEQKLGRFLERGEVVHHKNGDKQDNRLANLELFATNGDHLRHELTGKCPKWTPAGKARILAACRRGGNTTRLRRERDALAKRQKTARLKANSG